MISLLNIDRVRSECRNSVENLEIWIRNVIDTELRDKYGIDYWNYIDAQGRRLISNSIIKDAKARYDNEPKRYSRFIDAFLLDDVIRIICNPELFKNVFKQILSEAYPDGNDEARTFLNRLIPIRNKLYHANPISSHEALQIMCYSNDVISSIKSYYKRKNLEKKYNAPTIIRISDSFGNQFMAGQISRNSTGRGHCDTRASGGFSVVSGDQLKIEVEVDPSFDSSDYTINWVFDKKDTSNYLEAFNSLTLDIENKHIRTDYVIYCLVTSKEEWHRCGDVDDAVGILYEIVPRI
ncbi:hypothetical protein [Lunatibacter salilacus]|uniref:hypothetical protein n=1 Tax=Lunatibacter salilacus TaxID=2483804 RepID=UPI00131BFF63|nr:hypothetical protein [Lunatibacter salilacus]